MRTELFELTEDLRIVTNPEEFWDRIGFELSEFGITQFLYGAVSSRNEVLECGFNKSVVLKSNYPREFLELFEDSEFLENDLTAYRALTAKISVWHHEELWEDVPLEQKAHSDLEFELGLRVGMTLPTEMFATDSLGGIGFCAGELDPNEFDQMWSDHGHYLYQIFGLLDVGMREQHLASIIGLAPREKEVLQWLAIGRRPDQIAHRLNIGYRTVDKYINSAKRKLKASTRDQAVAKALIFNAIEP